MVTLKTLYGTLYGPDWPDDLICRSLWQFGEWSEAEAEVLAPLVRPDDHLWDVGAFLGTFSLGLTRHQAPIRLLAIEANPALQPFLTRNIAENARCPATVLGVGVAEVAGRLVPCNAVDLENHGATRWMAAAPDAGETEGTACLTLRDLRARHGDYSFLKLDIEGMELAALRGDLDHIARNHPVIWAECNESHASLKLLGALKWLGYEPLYVAFPAFRRANFKGSKDSIFPMAYEAGLLAAPPDRLVDFTGLVAGEDILIRRVNTAYDLRRALWDTPRWAQADWLTLSRPELIARLGRITKGQGLKEFLAD